MKNLLNINIESTPPSVDEIAWYRNVATEQIESSKRKIWCLCWLSRSTLTASLLVSLFLYVSGWIEGSEALGAVPFFLFSFARLEGALLTILIGVLVAMLGMVSSRDLFIYEAVLIAGPSIVYLITFIFTSILNDEINDEQLNLSSLTELSVENPDHHDPLIEYQELVEDDDVVQRYQAQIAHQGRPLILAEYHAATAWVGSTDERIAKLEKREAAMVACKIIYRMA